MNQTDLTGFIVEIIEGRLWAGWELPLIVTVVSANGCVMSGAYKPNENGDGIDYEEHVNQAPAIGMRLPIHIVVSRDGEAVEVTLTTDGMAPVLPFSRN